MNQLLDRIDALEAEVFGSEPPPPPPVDPQCNDNVDNDSDGLVDLNDPGCASVLDDDESDDPLPPPPPDDEFAAKCSGSGVLACDALTSIDSIAQAQTAGAAVPNSPSNPETNNNCRWNGGDRDCFPPFRTGDCSAFDSALLFPGQAQTSDIDRARLWAACYDPSADGARMAYWADRGSSIARIGDWSWSTSSPNEFWLQFELRVSSEMFFNPTGSSSAKLFRIDRNKVAPCSTEKRFMDVRIWEISPQRIRIVPMRYCPEVYLIRADAFEITPSDANKWFRITIGYVQGATVLTAVDVATGQTVHSVGGLEPQMIGGANMTGGYFTVHSTAHDPDVSAPSPNFWLRKLIVSTQPIAP